MLNAIGIEKKIKQVLRGSPLYEPARKVKEKIELTYHSAALTNDALIKPRPKEVFLSMTANCNLRCKACCYGRDFMPGHQLPWELGAQMIDDCKDAGIETIRLYGGEPLIHRDIDKFVDRIGKRDLGMYVTTNGLLLDKKIDRLVDAGLKRVSIGFYGIGDEYDAYTQRKGSFEALSRSVAATRRRHGPETLPMSLDWLLMRSTGTPESVAGTLQFARDHQMQIYINLIHYSLPYFVSDKDKSQKFWFEEEDRPLLEQIIGILLEVKRKEPDLIRNTERGIRSIPDWLIKKSEMRIPCMAYDMLWIGPDGTVRMCFVTFELGNLNDKRLSEMLFNETHNKSARDAFKLNCPNCNCGYDKRTARYGPSRAKYGP